MTRKTLLIAGLVTLVLAFIGGWVGCYAWRVNRPDKPSLWPSAGGRQIVGSAACVDCHSSIAELYGTSGHAHTFHQATDLDLTRRLAGTTFEDPQRHHTFHYALDGEGLVVALPEVFGDERFPLTYALGSGTHATSFLTLLPRRDGETVGLEHRVTYYQQLAGLGLTVGHPFVQDPVEDAEQFGRVVDSRQLEKCIACHTTQARLVNHELTELIPHVGCENCHGPGGDHVTAQQAGRTGPEFRVAHRWPTALDEIQTCGACHRMPESLKASELVRNSRVLPRFQPAGLMQSRCYTQSGGALRCTTCHDPHAKVSSDLGRYEQTCRDCHQRQSVAFCPQGTERCVNCHMPAVTFEGVAAFHDHWIRIRTADDPPPRSATHAAGQ